MRKLLMLLPFAAALFLFGCKKDASNCYPEPSTPEPQLTAADQLRTQFAKILAKAVTDAGVRHLLRKEALKQFDNDYDVLFQLVKELEIEPGLTFIDHLAALGLTEDMRGKIDQELPLLTIMVPRLEKFSAAQWNTESEIPIVAVLNSTHNEKKRTPVAAFDHQGNQYGLKSNEHPSLPVIVVKDNERIVLKPVSNGEGRTDKSNFVFRNQSGDYYFMDNLFNRQKTGDGQTAKLNVSVMDLINNRVLTAYSNNAVSQRDYVYYNILNPGDQGPLNINYGEYIAGIVFNPAAENHIYDDYYDDWLDGAFEFQLDVLMFNGSSTMTKITKLLPIPNDANIFHNDDVVRYHFPQEILIATWNMKTFGDTWKYVLNELDPGTVTTLTFSSSTKIGSNFSYNSSTGEEYKVGTGFGSTGEQTFSSSLSIQITDGSDFCGEAIVNYMTPLIIGSNIKKGFVGPAIYYFSDINTGSARILVYPMPLH